MDSVPPHVSSGICYRCGDSLFRLGSIPHSMVHLAKHISVQISWCWVPSLTATLTCYHIHLTPQTHTHTCNKVHIIIFIQCTVQVTLPCWWLTAMNNYTAQQKAHTVNARYCHQWHCTFCFVLRLSTHIHHSYLPFFLQPVQAAVNCNSNSIFLTKQWKFSNLTPNRW